MLSAFYSGKRVLITGHTGFKGSWLALWLKKLGSTVVGYSKPAPTDPNLNIVVREHAVTEEVVADINDTGKLREAVARFKPDIIFHLAAQPLVRRSYAEPVETFATNVIGTINLSLLDGWWEEGFVGKNGWAVKPASDDTEAGVRDKDESQAFYEILQDQVIPMYYRRGKFGYSAEWVKMAKYSIASLLPRYNATRMVI